MKVCNPSSQAPREPNVDADREEIVFPKNPRFRAERLLARKEGNAMKISIILGTIVLLVAMHAPVAAEIIRVEMRVQGMT